VAEHKILLHMNFLSLHCVGSQSMIPEITPGTKTKTENGSAPPEQHPATESGTRNTKTQSYRERNDAISAGVKECQQCEPWIKPSCWINRHMTERQNEMGIRSRNTQDKYIPLSRKHHRINTRHSDRLLADPIRHVIKYQDRRNKYIQTISGHVVQY